MDHFWSLYSSPLKSNFHELGTHFPDEPKLLGVDEVGELSEHKFSGMHPESLAGNLLGENRLKFSNRSHPLTSIAGR